MNLQRPEGARSGIWYKSVSIRRLTYAVIFLILWQAIFSAGLFPEILFPSPIQVIKTLFLEFADGSMFQKIGYSLYLILIGIGISVGSAIVLVILSVSSRTVKDIVKMLISIMDPLPGIALLPLAILWVGIGKEAILFVIIHSVLWPIMLNVLTGFDSVPKIYTEIGQNIGLRGIQMILGISVPAAFPSILTGLKTGWSRAWRALISAEMVFGATGVIGGLGWDIYLKRSYLDMKGMFATLIVIMLLGSLVEELLFRKIEKATVYKWGMLT